MANALHTFEENFRKTVQAQHAFAFWKGRVSLYALLRALDIGSGHEVILPGYTCVMDVNPVTYVGARPVYVDIEPHTYNIDINLLRTSITDKTKLILAQHTYGYPCDMDPILELARQKDIPVVEDCCLALGSLYKGQLCGTMGLAAYWSFQWNKPFTTGIGGMATTSDPDLANRLQSLTATELQPPSARAAAMLSAQRLVYRTCIYPRTTALATNLFRWLTRKGIVIGSSATCEFQPKMPDGFFRGMSTAQARAGLRQLRRLDSILAHRRDMARFYDELLPQAGFQPSTIPSWMEPTLVRYPLRVADKQRALAEAPRHFIELGSWFESPLHPEETPLQAYGYEPGMCPIAEQACRDVVNLPTHRRANRKTAERTVAFVQQFGR